MLKESDCVPYEQKVNRVINNFLDPHSNYRIKAAKDEFVPGDILKMLMKDLSEEVRSEARKNYAKILINLR